MSTKASLKTWSSADGSESFHIYEDVFEEQIVFLNLEGVSFEASSLKSSKPSVTIRLSREQADALGILR